MRIKYVSEKELQRIFNEGRYYERMREGDFHIHIVRQNRCRRGDRRVRNSWSQTVDYRDTDGKRIARVHQYRLRDGSLGGSGKPDPKVVVVDDVMYVLADREDWDLPVW